MTSMSLSQKALFCGEFFPFYEKYFEKEYVIKISLKFFNPKKEFLK
jgi:hypothetical protein